MSAPVSDLVAVERKLFKAEAFGPDPSVDNSTVRALLARISELEAALADVKLWTEFELKDNATRQPWKRRLDRLATLLAGGKRDG